jgi:hypothetical protein
MDRSRRARGDHETCAKSRRQLDRRPREGGDIDRHRALHRLRRDPDILERIARAAIRDRPVAFPKPLDDLESLGEGGGVGLEIDAERRIFAPVVAAPGGEIDTPAAQEIERRPLLGDADRVMQRQDVDRRREPEALRLGGDIGQHQLGCRVHAQRAEMMLADPGRVETEFFGEDRLGDDILDEVVGRTRIVAVVVVAQREIAKIHPFLAVPAPLPSRSRIIAARTASAMFLQRVRHLARGKLIARSAPRAIT